MELLARFSKKVIICLILLTLTAGLCILPACSGDGDPSGSSTTNPGSNSNKTYKLTYSFWGNTNESMARVAERYIAEIESKTNGRVDIVWYSGGSLTTGPTAYQGVVDGLSDMALVMMTYTPGRFPLTQAWHLPLGFTNNTDATQMKMDSYREFMPAELTDTKIMYIFSAAPTQILSKKPINSLDDLKGMKLRCDGSTAGIIAALGASPVSMPIGDVYDAMQKGIVDGTINVPGVLYDFKFYDFIKYMYKWNINTQSIALVMNNNVWNSLPADIQQVFEEANEKYMWEEVEEWNANDVRGLETAVEKGMQVIELDPEIAEKLPSLYQPLFEKYVADTTAKGLEAQAFLDFCQQAVK